VVASAVVDWASEAGLEEFPVLDIEDPLWRFARR
jgi:hypothetical protein